MAAQMGDAQYLAFLHRFNALMIECLDAEGLKEGNYGMRVEFHPLTKDRDGVWQPGSPAFTFDSARMDAKPFKEH